MKSLAFINAASLILSVWGGKVPVSFRIKDLSLTISRIPCGSFKLYDNIVSTKFKSANRIFRGVSVFQIK